MLRIHRRSQSRPDILRQLAQQRADLVQWSLRLLPQLGSSDFLSDGEDRSDLERPLRGTDFGAVVRDVRRELGKTLRRQQEGKAGER